MEGAKSKTVLPITPAVANACDLLEGTTGELIKVVNSLVSRLGLYESEVESRHLLILVIRNVEAVVELARRDLVLLPAALAVARAAFEIATKAAWMVDADDPFDREVRWLAHLQEEERVLRRVIDRLSEAPPQLSQRLDGLNEFRTSVGQLLAERGKQTNPHCPNMEDMLRSLRLPSGNHADYVLLSQYVHGGHAATSLYRTGIGGWKRSGEFIAPSSWHLPFSVSWLALGRPCDIVCERLGGQRPARDEEGFAQVLADLQRDAAVADRRN